jgi:NAD(P)-dependent dehydrogenase (short-subunit alcohol dehydrogenase family)
VILKVSLPLDITKNRAKQLLKYKIIALIALLCLYPPQSQSFDNENPTVFITGSNRNIGLEFVKQFSANNWNVIATARNPQEASELQTIAAEHNNVVIEQLDVTNHEQIESLAEKYKDQPIDILLSNAALTPRYKSALKKIKWVDFDIARSSFEINVLGPLKLIQSFMPNVEKSQGKKIIALSSKVGSFGERPKIPFMYSYSISKAALNSLLYSLSFESKRKNILVVAISPGMVNTTPGMKLPGAVETEESVTKMMQVIEGLTMNDNGHFIDYEDGRKLAW